MVSHLGRAAMKKFYYIYLFIIVHESRAERDNESGYCSV